MSLVVDFIKTVLITPIFLGIFVNSKTIKAIRRKVIIYRGLYEYSKQ
jgi:hypothetical protein